MAVTRRIRGAVLCGVVAAAGAGLLGLPGNGAWIAVAVGAGAVAAVVVSGLRGLLGGLSGIAIQGPLFTVLMPGASLVWLAIAIEGAVFGYGFLVGSVAGRAWRLRTLVDEYVVLGTAVAIGLVVLLVSLAEGLARNPP